MFDSADQTGPDGLTKSTSGKCAYIEKYVKMRPMRKYIFIIFTILLQFSFMFLRI